MYLQRLANQNLYKQNPKPSLKTNLVLSSRQVTLRVKVLNNLLNSINNRQIDILNVNLGLLRSLVRSRDTSEILNDTSTSLLVQSLGVTLLSNLNGNINVHLDERQTGLLTRGGDLVQSAGGVTVLLVGGDERGNGDRGGISEELSDLSDTADVLVTVSLAESEVLVQSETDVVAIEAVGVDAAVADELLLELDGESGLSGGAEAGKPDCETLLVAEGGALGAGDARGVEGDVAAGC